MSDANKPKADGPTLTDRDVEILVAAIRSTEGGLARPDMPKFAEAAGFKNPATASVTFGSLKKKIMGDAAPVKTPKKATPGGKRKQPTPKDAGEDDADETPSKKPKRTPKKAIKKESASEGEPEEGGDAAFV